MRGVEHPWLAEAKRLREVEKLTYRAIAKIVGCGPTAVIHALDPVMREKKRERARLAKLSPHRPKTTPMAPKRVPRKPIPREDIMAAARAFARNEIVRDELMRRITPA